MVDELSKRFAENLAHYLSKSGLSQEALAARAEVHRTQVSELLRGQGTQPRLGTIIRLAGALGIDPADLIEGMSFEPAAQTGKVKVSRARRT